METLQREIEKLLTSMPQQLIAETLVKKLGQQGVVLSEEEVQILHEKIKRNKLSDFTLSRPGEDKTIEIELTEEDLKQCEQSVQKLNERLPEIIDEVTTSLSPKLLDHLKTRWQEGSHIAALEVEAFRERLQERWKAPFGRLRMFLAVARELGSETNDRLRQSQSTDDRNLIEVLTRLHARGCQVMEEITCLICAGFADGAMARWRTLHEIAVVALFVGDRGDDVARRYIDHQIIESRRAAAEYNKCCPRLGYSPIAKRELNDLEKSCRNLIAKYGDSFESQYGWAATALGTARPTFSEIERSSGVDHLRSHYRLASHNVHANPKGAFYKLGMCGESQLLLSGPTNSGFTDPAHCAAISLLQITSTLGTISPTVDTIVGMKSMSELVTEIGDEFGRVQDLLDKEEAALKE